MTRLSYQQRIALKGQEGTIAHFTNLLRDIKKATSVNSAETIESAIEFWTSYGCSKPASDPTVCFMQRSQFYCPSRQEILRAYFILFLPQHTDLFFSGVVLNTESDSLWRTPFHTHTNGWITMNGVFPESWWTKVCCIDLCVLPRPVLLSDIG